MDLSVVVPVYNEAENLPLLVNRIREEMEQGEISYEVLLVDDGSTDSSDEILKDMCAEWPNLRTVLLGRNFGQTAALAAGIRGAKGEWIATLDGDLQNDPADILPLLKLCKEENFDVVSGWRKFRKDRFLRTYISKIANRIASGITGLKLHDYGCSMKVYRRSVLQKIRLSGEMHRFLPIYAFLKGARVTETPVKHHPRQHGSSKYGFFRILRVLVDMLMFYFLFHSRRPLAFFGRLSLFFLFTSILFAAVYLVKFATVPGLVSLLFLQFSASSVLFGLILELIIRTHYLSQNETQYSIKEIVNFESHPDFAMAGDQES